MVKEFGIRTLRTPNCRLTESHVETGRVFNISSSRNGSYTLSALPTGTYELLIPDIGFTYSKYERKNIALRAAQNLRLDLRLEWGINLGTPGDDDTTILRDCRVGLRLATVQTCR